MVNKQQNNLQDIFLNNGRKNKIPLTIHLLNGFQLKGVVKGFDSFTVVLECENKQMLIYKHSISTITPSEPILFVDNESTNK
ncbi:RNA chaperone Hfq [Clostridium saccharobutylicum]|uniref:RNA-binding protein Hfq n=1 Tax=Clostridium saccharobutylicum DSM 13864 TaxID=1345695 RepID=U5MRI6_CLOSA|nr:RNA chaperone Hfq [Clostridium saccharobutylicum]AGX43225.1 protein Hfq [Clostridium saccharobutylicum DSM 13864]AQR90524.1 RNA-binding protein Hfq [Clostridium saccharobutylicum]AQS00430.1 RNA-binding protein Hfq [Clostridium saccharobutylicum]AQS10079.1 RNA-binding protein Hfq [Clostridium saccharobutylicum]AQS14413.1 RNA-binding protein Hfq [Clostridium saccharobutylicum]